MKKIIIAALTMLTLGATQAEYTLQIPLEQTQGGSLPNGSIKFSTSNITPPAEDTRACTYRAIYPEAYWSSDPNGGLRAILNHVLVLDNDKTKDINGEYPISVIYDGKTYSRGAIVNSWPHGAAVYEICVTN